ncbi:MAG: hypothetical protein GY847_16035 [Proteobacteria bacterium]|nr:hypothetical protein [Pseudomonadota bacterium]
MNVRLSDDRGAVMVMAVFVAVLLVGLVYHVSGVGGAALEQQIMQDAADATVFSAATTNARGMNILALINLIMVALLTILAALRLAQAILVCILAIASVLCAIPFTSAACSIVGLVEPAIQGIDKAADAYQSVAKGLIQGLNQAADVVNEVVPYIALGEGVYVSANAPYDKVAIGGIVWPIFDGLPTKEGKYSELCKRAGENIGVPFKYILPGRVGEFAGKHLGDLIGELTQTFSSYFCGDDGNGGTPDEPKKKVLKSEVGYPPGRDKNSDMRKCADEDPGVHPDQEDGRCDSNMCKRCARMGCKFCFKKMKNKQNYVKGVWTVVQNHWVEWLEPNGVGGYETIKVVARSGVHNRWRLKDNVKGNPCLHPDNPDPIYDNSNCGVDNDVWMYDPDDRDEDKIPVKTDYYPKPICETIGQEEVTDPYDIAHYLRLAHEEDESMEYEHTPRMTLKEQTLYLSLNSCVVEEEIEVEHQGESIANGKQDKETMAPRVLDTDRFPGEAEMTSILWGKSKASRRGQEVAIASEESPSRTFSDNRVSFAAAEYYSQNSDNEAMWHMKWLSRFIRFQWDDTDSNDKKSSDGIRSDNNGDGMERMSKVKDFISDKLGTGVEINDYLLH